MSLTFEFEVRETDLLGRNGTINVNGKRFATPCLLPVVHPVRQLIPMNQLHEMGFEALMTNSFILYKRLREEALQKGLHSLLAYDGALMTDSGGYQVLEYGSVEVSNIQIAEFQVGIGSDLAVTLDRPTGYSRSVRHARSTTTQSLKSAIETITEFGDSDTTWVGPIQGGLFPRLISMASRRLVNAGFRFLALGSPTPVMENYHFDELVNMILAARRNMPYSMPLHLFGAGHPLTMALSVALGSDTFDSASYILFARQGRYMTERGILNVNEMEYLPCSCPACNSTSPNELKGLTGEERIITLSLHNLYLLRKEMMNCRQAISEGRLWDVVEERAAAHPSVQAALLEIAKHSDSLEAGTPMLKERGLLVRGATDLFRPELRIASRRLNSVRKRRAPKALLLVGPDGMPSSLMRLSTGNRRALERGEVDLYRLHPQLGPYPSELDFVYPFTQTVQVDTHVGDDSILEGIKRLKSLGYMSVRELRDDGDRYRPVRKSKSRPR